MGATSTPYTYDAADRLGAAGSVTYGSDPNGNRTSRGSNTYAYDQANRLKSATVAGVSSQYGYDGAGKRTSKTVGGTTTTYSYDVGRRLPVMTEDGARKYVWGPGLAYATDASGTNVLHVYHKDALGSVWALSDANGQVTDTYQRDPWGVPGARQGTSTQPFGFAGEPLDAETGLLYLRARMYDPETGRFMQRDPFAGFARRPGTLNRYVYVGDGPVNLRDPGGLQDVDSGGVTGDAEFGDAAPAEIAAGAADTDAELVAEPQAVAMTEDLVSPEPVTHTTVTISPPEPSLSVGPVAVVSSFSNTWTSTGEESSTIGISVGVMPAGFSVTSGPGAPSPGFSVTGTATFPGGTTVSAPLDLSAPPEVGGGTRGFSVTFGETTVAPAGVRDPTSPDYLNPCPTC